MSETEHERLELLDAIKNLAALIEQSTDPDKIVEYVQRLDELKGKLVLLGPARKSAKQP